jgi:hypothetical protein
MLDIIIIGKRSLNRNDKPEVVYCGQSRAEMEEAVADASKEFPRMYQLNPESVKPIVVLTDVQLKERDEMKKDQAAIENARLKEIHEREEKIRKGLVEAEEREREALEEGRKSAAEREAAETVSDEATSVADTESGATPEDVSQSKPTPSSKKLEQLKGRATAARAKAEDAKKAAERANPNTAAGKKLLKAAQRAVATAHAVDVKLAEARGE